MADVVPPRFMPTANFRCCRSEPRCRTCPLRFVTEMRQAEALANGTAAPRDLPQHLADVPACLHKYEPLLRRAEAR
jgi:hypothetical protein